MISAEDLAAGEFDARSGPMDEVFQRITDGMGYEARAE
jgi:hypothetical protein